MYEDDKYDVGYDETSPGPAKPAATAAAPVFVSTSVLLCVRDAIGVWNTPGAGVYVVVTTNPSSTTAEPESVDTAIDGEGMAEEAVENVAVTRGREVTDGGDAKARVVTIGSESDVEVEVEVGACVEVAARSELVLVVTPVPIPELLEPAPEPTPVTAPRAGAGWEMRMWNSCISR